MKLAMSHFLQLPLKKSCPFWRDFAFFKILDTLVFPMLKCAAVIGHSNLGFLLARFYSITFIFSSKSKFFRFMEAESWNFEQDIFPWFTNALEHNPHKYNAQIYSNILLRTLQLHGPHARFNPLASLRTFRILKKKFEKSGIIVLFQEVKQSPSWNCL